MSLPLQSQGTTDMELHTAVDRVSKFVAKTKGAVDVLKRIRFFPAGRDTAAHVYGTDGQVGVVIPVDVDVPDMALDASSLTALMRDPISQVYMDPGATVPTVIFRSKSGAGYAILHQASTGHPMFPDYPTELTTIPAWDVVQKSFHAALPPAGEVSGNPRPDLECVHFAEGRVEATDSYRIVITDVETGLRGRVPVSVFRYWPKRVEVASVFTDTHAWFRAGEEMRFVQLRPTQPGPNRDLREQFVPLHHDGPWMVVPSKRFHGVVKKAVKTSPLDQVVLRYGVLMSKPSSPMVTLRSVSLRMGRSRDWKRQA